MTRIAEFRKTITDTNPLLAYVGAADLVVEKAREARVDAEARRAKFRAEAKARRAKFQAEYAPTQLREKAAELPTQAQARYEDLAVRGEKLVERVRNQKATKDLVAQAEATLSLGKGAITTARNGAAEVERSAKALFTTGRREAVKAADAISESVADEAATVTAEVKGAAVRTRTAAKRTSTTTKKAGTRTRTTAKATTTSARKTAAGATKAAEKAAQKVGA